MATSADLSVVLEASMEDDSLTGTRLKRALHRADAPTIVEEDSLEDSAQPWSTNTNGGQPGDLLTSPIEVVRTVQAEQPKPRRKPKQRPQPASPHRPPSVVSMPARYGPRGAASAAASVMSSISHVSGDTRPSVGRAPPSENGTVEHVAPWGRGKEDPKVVAARERLAKARMWVSTLSLPPPAPSLPLPPGTKNKSGCGCTPKVLRYPPPPHPPNQHPPARRKSSRSKSRPEIAAEPRLPPAAGGPRHVWPAPGDPRGKGVVPMPALPPDNASPAVVTASEPPPTSRLPQLRKPSRGRSSGRARRPKPKPQAPLPSIGKKSGYGRASAPAMVPSAGVDDEGLAAELKLQESLKRLDVELLKLRKRSVSPIRGQRRGFHPAPPQRRVPQPQKPATQFVSRRPIVVTPKAPAPAAPPGGGDRWSTGGSTPSLAPQRSTLSLADRIAPRPDSTAASVFSVASSLPDTPAPPAGSGRPPQPRHSGRPMRPLGQQASPFTTAARLGVQVTIKAPVGVEGNGGAGIAYTPIAASGPSMAPGSTVATARPTVQPLAPPSLGRAQPRGRGTTGHDGSKVVLGSAYQQLVGNILQR